MTTAQALHLGWLHGRADLSLVDEVPEFTLDRLSSSACASVAVQKLPLWSTHVSHRVDAALQAFAPSVVLVNNFFLVVRYQAALRNAARRGASVVLVQHSGVLTMTPRRAALLAAFAVLAPTVGLRETVYVSAATARWWHRRFPWLALGPHRVIHNGVPLPPSVTHPVPSHRIAVVGRVEREKGCDLLPRIAQGLAARGSNLELHIYGDGALLTHLKKFASPRFVLHGQVASSDEALASADLLLVPSPIENCPYVVLEARVRGVPTVAASVGGIPEIVRHGVDGWLVPDRRPETFVSGLIAASECRENLRNGCLAGRATADIRLWAERFWAPYLQSIESSAPRVLVD